MRSLKDIYIYSIPYCTLHIVNENRLKGCFQEFASLYVNVCVYTRIVLEENSVCLEPTAIKYVYMKVYPNTCVCVFVTLHRECL